MTRENQKSRVIRVGTWWNDSDIEIIKVGGKVYALNEWNGEEYTSCWECIGKDMTPSAESYTLRPVYRYQAAGIQIERIEENSPEWDSAVEVIDYDIS